MKFARSSDSKALDRATLIVNPSCNVLGIPDEAHDYVLSSRTALEWVLERYQTKTDKASGIVNDPNDWAESEGQPNYILDLIGRVVQVSVKTISLTAQLPKFEILK